MTELTDLSTTRGITANAKTPPGKDNAGSSERLLVLGVGAMVVIQLWFGLIASSFWLDEAGTWWIVKDRASDVVHRAFLWGGVSPFYYLVAWASSQIFGLNEIALRLPSVLAISGTIYFLFRIAESLFDRTTAVLVAFIFLCATSSVAIDARPYALAMFCLTVSVWALLRWVDKNRPADAVIYVIGGASLVYAHCLLALGLVPAVIYGAATTWNQPRRRGWLFVMEVMTGLLCAPLIPQLKEHYATRSAHTIAGLPSAGDILEGFIPCSLAGALVLLVWLAMSYRRDATIAGKCTKPAALLIGSWALFAPVFLFLLPIATDLRLFVSRYYSSALPGQALLLGGLISSMRVRGVRNALILILGVASILVHGRITVNSHGGEDWRAAMQFVIHEVHSAPVLLVCPFAEGTDFEALRDPKIHDVLFAPELMYGEPRVSIRVPHLFPTHETAELENVANRLHGVGRFYLLNDKPDSSYVLWLLGRLGSQCRSERVQQNFGDVWLERFTCGT